ncbi:DNA glycosylase [Podospora conica]|nr:DNA glycosylase [Schizothecium conicum]
MKGGWVLPHGMGVVVDHVATTGEDDSLIHHEKATDDTLKALAGQIGHIMENQESPGQTEDTVGNEDAPDTQGNTPVQEEDTNTSERKNNSAFEQISATPEADIHRTEEAIVEKEASTVDQDDALEETLTGGRAKRPRAKRAESSKSAAEIAAEARDPNYRRNIKKQDNKYSLTPGYSPYPYRSVPTREDCYEVYRILAEMHGECMPPTKMPAASLEVAGCGEVPCVLDALLRTLVSGNTTMERANQAIQSLVAYYGLREHGTGKGSIDWEKVRVSSEAELIKVLRTAGSAPKRSGFIKGILDTVYEENLVLAKAEAAATGKAVDMSNLLSLDHMHKMTKDEAMIKFISYRGIGIKTAACVILFCLQKPCFAVDTHVHRFCGWLGWTPPKADPDNCYRHTDFMVPDELKYGLHQLFIRHGQLCFKCRAITKPGTKDWNDAADCPLEHLLTRNKTMAASTKGPKRKIEEITGEDSEEEGSEYEERAPKKPRVTKKKIEEIADELVAGGWSEEEGSEYEERAPKKWKKVQKPRVKAKKDDVKEEEADVQTESE